MTTTNPNFTDAEYEARIARTRAEMEKRGLDLMIISDPSNMNWISGYDGWSFYVHQAVLLPMEGEPVWWGRGIDGPGAARTVFMRSPDSVVPYDDTYVQNPQKHTMEALAALIVDRGWNTGWIGVEMDNYYYSAAAHQTLVNHLHEARFEDATGLVNWQRLVKSESELLYIRRAARIVERMHKVILDVAEPGMPKNMLVAEITRAGIEGADGQWGDYPAIVPMAPSGLDATAAHLTWDDRPMRAGESTFFEIAGVHRRYHCPQSRTLFFGAVPDLYRHAEEAVLEATEAGLAQCYPGARAEDVANAFNAALNKRGFEKDNRCGYSIGLSYPPDWGERTLSLRRGDMTELKPGMVMHFMPALWLEDGGLEITEPVLITEHGPELLCTTPREIFVK
ncbi:M24 family metallopeptidase [Roseibaca sp. Y0-43]|uniref:M24 family metallopeptidase n=1 Tax=Roseibaca sp. Y0-43 TaxID=2816854 RepID=UPI001D0C8DA2|nr:M24 family metallopeptidase [Roseibaca sp. Y0-43]MCC1481601.1 M24 family metallopeptidase [Roseibaca sp. Y0-43]